MVRDPVRRSRTAQRGSSAAQKTAWRAAYERERYSELPWFQPGPSPQVRAAARTRFWPPGADVLDIGCGAGSNVLFLAGQGYRAHGIDLSPIAVRAAASRAARLGRQIDVREGDALALPFGRARFDGVMDNGCFHTLPIPRRDDYAAEVARVLRPGGGFLLMWIGREYTEARGPPHRPSVDEIAGVFESRFQFSELRFREPNERSHRAPAYIARMIRRRTPQPPRR
jgi:SAM-dependent methyltransferase